MKNKIVRKLLILSLSSTVALSSTIGVSAATVTDTTAEQTKEAEEPQKDTEVKEETEETKEETESKKEEAKTETTAETKEVDAKKGHKNERRIKIVFVEEGTNQKVGRPVQLWIPKDAGNFNTSKLQVPKGYEVVNAGDVPVDKDQKEVRVAVRKKVKTKTVMVNYVDEKGNSVSTGSITLKKDETYFNTSILTDVPYGWELADMGDITVGENNTVDVVVREKEYQKDVIINYVDEAGNSVATSSIKLHKGTTYFNTSILTDVPYGWELANVGDITVGENNTVDVVVREKEYTKDVVINYVDEAGNSVATSSIKLHKDTTYFNTSILKDVPYGWELASVGDVTVNEDNTANVVVRQKEYKRTVIINYVDEAGNSVATSSIELDENETYFNTSILKDVPYGWELANVGDVTIKDSTANVVVRQKEYKRTVTINYVDEAGNSVATSSIELDENATYFNTSILKDVPYGWELASVGDIAIKDSTANVVVRQKEYKRDVIINYVDEEGNPVLTSSIQLDEDATYFNTSILKDVPYGWELANVGDIPVKDSTATVVVREKKYQRDVIINYVNEEGNSVATGSIKLDENATYFNTSILKDVPYGWELANVGDIPVKEGTATVVVREKEYQKDIIINYVDEKGNPVLTSGLKVSKDSTYINTSWLKDVPYGWELAIVGDLPIDNNVVTVVVREKEYQKDVIINYVDENGNPVLTSSIKLSKDATYFNTSILKDVPYGWELAIVGDIPVNEDNTATVVVRQKKYTKDVVVEYVTEDGVLVKTGCLTVSEESTYINTSWLQDVPEGYEIAIVGDIVIEDGKVKVVVRGTEKPENPDPENPEKPENPDSENPAKPENPNKPDQEKPSKPEDTNKPNKGTPVDTDKKEEAKKDTKKAVKTGDETNTAPLFAGLFGSGVIGLGMLQFLKRKKEDK